ncbi:MAG: TM2 domain-containing protein [Ferruginibacter sp.]
MNQNLVTLIPSVEPDELAYLQELTKGLSDDKLKLFISIYNGKRKKAETILICCLLGFVCFAGIQRFVVGQMGMGILYLFTGGLCLIGTIVDVINHKELAYEFNQKMALESMAMIKVF